jgi:hypothetical protein
MDNRELKYQITALIDGELPEDIAAEIRKSIDADPKLQREYEILRFTKTLVQKKCEFRKTPAKARKRIIKRLHYEEDTSPQPLKFLQYIFSQPKYALTGALALILITVILIFNQEKVPIPDLASEQYGEENMFLQASSNFNNILAGKLVPQLLTDNAENIRKFFAEQGVKYPTCIPTVEQWKIVGAVVSEAGGEKFAHHVYSNEKGNLVYLFQVDKSFLNKCEVIKLSKHMIEYLDSGNCYLCTKDNCTMLMRKMDNNICAIVSNAPKIEIENLFCPL